MAEYRFRTAKLQGLAQGNHLGDGLDRKTNSGIPDLIDRPVRQRNAKPQRFFACLAQLRDIGSHIAPGDLLTANFHGFVDDVRNPLFVHGTLSCFLLVLFGDHIQEYTMKRISCQYNIDTVCENRVRQK